MDRLERLIMISRPDVGEKALDRLPGPQTSLPLVLELEMRASYIQLVLGKKKACRCHHRLRQNRLLIVG
jgi:hypothetical protein